MKMFTYKDFVENNYTIPNADWDVQIVDVVCKDPWENNVNCTSIIYKGHTLVSFSKSRFPSVHFKNVEKAVELGVIKGDSRDIYISIIDSLYYMYNPLRFYSKTTNKLLVGFWKVLLKRTDYRCYSNSHVFDKMLEVLAKELEKRYDTPEHPKGSYEYNYLCNEDIRDVLLGRIAVCYFSGKFLTSHEYRRFKLDNKDISVGNEVDFDRLNLKIVDHGVLLRESQIYFRGKVYDKEGGFTVCPECGEEVPVGAIDQEEGICYSCLEKHYRIHSYSTKVPDLLKFKAKNVKQNQKPLYLGCELEYETSDKEVASVKVGRLLKGHAIMKSDGSIQHGFEIVSCPATLDIHMEEFGKFYSNLPTELSIASNVGMHVHVSKSPLSLFTIGKITAFMNKVDNKKFITFIAGREPNHYCNIDPKRTVTYPWLRRGGSERYNALNLNPKETIEFRIFSTPMSFDEFAYKMQFCKALVDYSMPASLSLPLKEQLSYTNFINWVLKQTKTYPQLVNKIKEFA